MSRLGLAAIALGSAVSACSAIAPPADTSSPSARPLRGGVHGLTFAPDRRSVVVDFYGAREFAADDPCSASYRGTAEQVGDELRITILEEDHPGSLPTGVFCDAMGHRRTVTIELSRPFDGTRVRAGGEVTLLAPPDRMAHVTALPEGWEWREEGDAGGGDSGTARWRRVYSPIPEPVMGDPQVELFHAFDGPAEVEGHTVHGTPEINGSPATLYLYEPTGEMVVVWHDGRDGFALVANLDHFTEEEFIRLAESVAPQD